MNRHFRRIISKFLLGALIGFVTSQLSPNALGATAEDANWEAMSAQLPGVDGRIDAFATLGSRLYAGGRFQIIGGLVTSGIGSWDGTRWSALGTGINGAVGALQVSGTSLIVGGSFTSVGGVAATNVARWDGLSWSALGNLSSQPVGEVLALAEFNGEIYAGGDFQTTSGAAANYLARWNGAQWLPVGGGVDGIVYALHRIADGLYAGGAFKTAGGQIVNGIARWDGVKWASLDQGVRGGLAAVYALSSIETNLYVGGDFTQVSGDPWFTTGGLARWIDGGSRTNQWRNLPGVGQVSVRALRGFEGRLFVGGRFAGIGGTTSQNVAELSATQDWIGFGTGVSSATPSDVAAIEPFGSGIFCGGFFELAGDKRVSGIARWTGTGWLSVGGGTDLGLTAGAHAVEAVGSRAYVLGGFLRAGPTIVRGAAEWTGSGWLTMGGGIPNWNQYYQLYAATDGRDLYVSTPSLQRWDGSAWLPVGEVGHSGGGPVEVSGTNLFAVGSFAQGYGVARLEGTHWTGLGGAFSGIIRALAISGSNVYAGGWFTMVGSDPIEMVAHWDGVQWQKLGTGLPAVASSGITALALSGGRLYVGQTGNERTNWISVWNGSAWSTLPGTFSSVGSGVFINSIVPEGSELYFGGRFDWIDGVPVNNIARWDGTNWHALGSGVGNGGGAGIWSLAVTADRVYAGGTFTTAGGKGSRYFAIWHKTPPDPDLIVNSTGDEPDADLTDNLPDVDPNTPGLQTTLRCAIDFANRRAGKDTIEFNIESGGSVTISPTTALPEITEPLVIDGRTQPGSNRVGVSGLLAGAVDGLHLGTSNCVIRSLVINQFQRAGILIQGGLSHTITGNILGTDANGTAGLGNGIGLLMMNSLSNIVGGLVPADRNVISANLTDGISITNSSDIEIRANFVGTTPDGNASLPNGRAGLLAQQVTGLAVGTPDLASVLNSATAVIIRNLDVGRIVNCFIGLTANGNASLGGTVNGLQLEHSGGFSIGGSSRNVFGGISSNAITLLETTNTQVLGNYIGTDQTGNTSLPVGTGIVAEKGQGLTVGSGGFLSVICATNGAVLRELGGLSNTLNNCLFGLAANGSNKLGNMLNGLVAERSSGLNLGGLARNIFAGISSNAITLQAMTNVQLLANFIGTDQTGNASVPVGTGIVVEQGRDLTIGSGSFLSVICATNGALLRELGGLSNTLNNCLFGLAANGSNKLGNMLNGLVAERSSGLNLGGLARNIFAGISSNAITLHAMTNVQLLANFIGTDQTGNTSVPVGTGIVAEKSRDLTIGSGSFLSVICATNGAFFRELSGIGTNVSSVLNCYFGLGADGTSKVGNMLNGLIGEQSSGLNLGGLARNIFAGISSNAVMFHSMTNVQVFANLFGTDATGTNRLPIGGNGITAIATRNLTVGNNAGGEAEGLVIGGCGKYGIEAIDSPQLRILNSTIGADFSGATSLSNDLSAVKVHFSAGFAATATSNTTVIMGNTIAFNGGAGVEFTQDPSVIADGSVQVVESNQIYQNAGSGIHLGSNVSSVTIGGTNLAQANQLVRNGGSGVSKVGTGDRILIEINNTASNAVKAVERVFDPQNQVAPQITSAIKGSTHVRGNVNGQPNQTLRLHFYAHRPKAGAQGEGEMWVGTVNVPLDSSGIGSYDSVLPRTAPKGWLVASTAADPVRGTSEFSASQVVQLPTDTDGDGMPDFWEALYPSCLNPLVPDANGDCDHDGFTNLQEYIAQTDPTKANSALRVESLVASSDGATLSFTGVAGRQYGLERRADLTAGTWVRVATAIPEADGQVALADPDSPSGPAYYRLVAEFP